MHTTLIVPGLHGSGPTHWQSWFQQVEPDARRVEQVDWSVPDLSVWAERVLAEIDAARGRILIVAHSFGCLAAVTAAAARPDRIAGALLVAPADPRKFGVSAVLPASPLGYPGILVSSSNDPWVSSSTARYWAGRWGCRFVDVGAKGHINVESGFGPWPEGYELYELLAVADRRPGPRQRPASLPADDAPPELPAAAPTYIPLYY